MEQTIYVFVLERVTVFSAYSSSNDLLPRSIAHTFNDDSSQDQLCEQRYAA